MRIIHLIDVEMLFTYDNFVIDKPGVFDIIKSIATENNSSLSYKGGITESGIIYSDRSEKKLQIIEVETILLQVKNLKLMRVIKRNEEK